MTLVKQSTKEWKSWCRNREKRCNIYARYNVKFICKESRYLDDSSRLDSNRQDIETLSRRIEQLDSNIRVDLWICIDFSSRDIKSILKFDSTISLCVKCLTCKTAITSFLTLRNFVFERRVFMNIKSNMMSRNFST